MFKQVLCWVAGAAMVASSALVATSAHAASPLDLNAPETVPGHSVDILTGSHTTGFGVRGNRWIFQTFVAPSSGTVDTVSFGGDFAAGSGLTAGIYAGNPAVTSSGMMSTPVSSGTATASAAGGTLEVTLSAPVALTSGATYFVGAKAIAGPSGERPWLGYRSAASGYGLQQDDGAWLFPLSRTWNISISTQEVPYIAATIDGAAAGDDWFSGDVDVTFACASIVTDCPSAQAITADDSLTRTGSITTTDESTYEWTYTAPVDRVKPTISGTPSAASPYGYDVTWTCVDAESGIATCPAPTYVSGLGGSTTATGTATDKAGNTYSATVNGLVTATYAPVITATGVIGGTTYPAGTKLTVGCSAVTAVPGATHSVPCTVAQSSAAKQGGATAWSATITAADSDARGKVGKLTVSWTVAAPAPKPKPAPSQTSKPQKQATKIAVTGFAKAPKRNGFPVLDYRKHYPVTAVLTAGGKPVAGKPVWLRSVKTTKAGKSGTPTTVMNTFRKQTKKGTWVNTFRIPKRYSGEYRKFGVRAPDGKVVHVTVYVK